MKKEESKLKLVKRGFRKICPMCGKRPLFSSYLKLVPKCENCKTNFTHYKTDDGPAYCTIFIVGHMIIPLIVIIERMDAPPALWTQLVIWPLLTIFISLWLLPKMKGAFLAFQISVKDRSS